ncbi:MAG: adenylate/guanylate cyclase domain-containing protein, partial [Candidatus Eremiobacteraeota bacterium]|nr:adenylate/guanylate cyclase domain-containing protein [Candidatus Eremiobacteraeota bacterium]
MTALPSGTVTFLFTDVENETLQWERDRAAMQEAVARYDAILREQIDANEGHVFKTVGDAFCVVFARPESAIASAAQAQRRLAAEDFSAIAGLRVRMAVHTGTAHERDGDYFGTTLNRVARLLGASYGGQVLVSGVTSELLRHWKVDEVAFRFLGRHRFKGLAHAEPVFQLEAPGLEKQFPVLRSLDAHPNNLPASLTSFIGREEQLSEVRRLFEQARLLTLTGAGGVGKTRLALELAGSALEQFEDGVWLVDLAGVSDKVFVAPTILAVLNVREEANRDPSETLVDFLHQKNLLLLLDNCEHIVHELAQLTTRLLRECARVRAIATSREVFGVLGEVVYRVPSFDEDESVTLFEIRAKAVLPSFSIEPENVEIVKRICKRLDGIPFAVELAAARVKMMGVEELWKRLSDRFRILTGGDRNALPRQRTLQGLLEWSYNLLEDSEKLLLQRLSSFAGTFSLDAASAICGVEPIEDFEVLDLLSRLIDKSLVQVETSSDQRYWMLESTKELARVHLAKAGETDTAAGRHAEYFFGRADAVWSVRYKPGFDEGCEEIASDYAEYRAALQWALPENHDVALGAKMSVELVPFWFHRGHSREGRYWLERVLERSRDDVGAETWAQTLVCVGNFYMEQGE